MGPSPGTRYRFVLQAATERLRACLRDAPAGAGETPYLDALVLLAHAAGLSSERLFALFDDGVPEAILATYKQLISQRCNGMPVSYIRGRKEFFGRDFEVGPGVLVPRPDTETLVETAIGSIDRYGAHTVHLHDCCTGSGCVALTIACERACRVTASDISGGALAFARRNAQRLNRSDVDFWQGDLLVPLRDRLSAGTIAPPQIITANPPYVADNEVQSLTDRGWPEPAVALAGGPDGLGLVRRLVREAAACLVPGGWLMVEIGSGQGSAASAFFSKEGFRDVSVVRDLGDRDRVCVGKWSGT